MIYLRRTLLLPLILTLAACHESDPETDSSFGPVGFDGGIRFDAALGTDAAVGPALRPDAASPVDAAVVVVDAAPGLDAAVRTDGAVAMDTGAPIGSPEGGLQDGSVADAALDAAQSDAARADAAAGDATAGDAAAGDASTGDAATADAAVPAPGAAQARTVSVGSVQRTFQLYIPKTAVKATPVPFVSVHHGFTMTGKIMEDISSWKKIAERERIVVAFPDGLDPPWNVGENVCSVGALVSAPADRDDFGFVKAMIASAEQDQAIKKDAVFVGGFSMGGYFANNAGCKARDFVRAVAAHSGGTYEGTCPGKPVPVLLIHGEADGLIEYACGTTARGYWVTRNGCTTQVTSEPIKNGTCEWNQGCPAGQEVGMCTLKGMDHGWAGAPTSGPGAWLAAGLGLNGNLDYGGGVEFEDAAEMMWKFFAKYR
jgi:polyhydroxybutyrate depolymerase